MVLHRLRLWLAVIIFCLSLAVLLFAAWPVPRLRETIPLPALSLPTPEAFGGWRYMPG